MSVMLIHAYYNFSISLVLLLLENECINICHYVTSTNMYPFTCLEATVYLCGSGRVWSVSRNAANLKKNSNDRYLAVQ